jgi:hypothetical protein
MKAAVFQRGDGKESLVVVSREFWKSWKKKGAPENVEGHPVKVQPMDEFDHVEHRTYHNLPMVVVDFSTTVIIQVNRIRGWVPIINITELVDKKKLIYLYGINNIFFIAKKIVPSSGEIPIEESEFKFRQDDSFKIDKDIRIYVFKMCLVTAIQEAMQANHNGSTVATASVSVHFEDWLSIMNELHIFHKFKESKKSIYSTYADGSIARGFINSDVAAFQVENVELFEKCFGFLSTFKYDISVKSLKTLLHANTTSGLFISRKDNDTKFERMEIEFDILTSSVRLFFNLSHRPPNEVANYFPTQYNTWKQWFDEKWVIEDEVVAPVENEVVSTIPTVAAEAAGNSKRKTTDFVFGVTKTKSAKRSAKTVDKIFAVNVLTMLLQPDGNNPTSVMDKNVKWLIDNIPLQSELTMGMGFVNLLNTYHNIDIDLVADAFHIGYPDSLQRSLSQLSLEHKIRDIKVNYIGSYLTEKYNDYSHSQYSINN